MSGKIPVYDVEQETALTDVTILSPRITKAAFSDVGTHKTRKESFRDTTNIPKSHKVIMEAAQKTFRERLGLTETQGITPYVPRDAVRGSLDEGSDHPSVTVSTRSVKSVLTVCTLTVLFLAAVVSLTLKASFDYENGFISERTVIEQPSLVMKRIKI
jgi:hypothetical protein